ncbi:Protein phosphatase 1 regulatory subunit 14C [Holothuria leucospilota]|uniref:Protein phosphatase 1 regulatory subunit 14C n=1 Tax=Holothuria leucospilota TaxID=206669 RepID=A0A9Q1HIA0_HOLLE|nr:Protein phosphatase 1 regulatory subunit 14C [Holothuria leucospilota]
MEVAKSVSFPSGKVSENGSRTKFPSNLEDEKTKKKNVNITCKYDRKQMRIRLEIEEWMDDQLRELYQCQDDEDYPIEIDIDDVLETEEENKRSMLKDILKDASQPVDVFITDLLKRIQALRKRPSVPSRVTMEMDL